MKSIVFFNNKGGVGKTSLVYHLSWAYAELGYKVIAADLDPQANLTSMFLEEERLEELWPESEHSDGVLGAINPILTGTGDIGTATVEAVSQNLGLIVGDLGLSRFEDMLSSAWPDCSDGKEPAFRQTSAFYRIVEEAAEAMDADLALIDVGPNLGAINRAAIIAADCVAIPLAPDLFSLQGLRNLGPELRRWRGHWKSRLQMNPSPKLSLPEANMRPIGYIIMQHAVRKDRPVKAYEKWMKRIPEEYRQSVLNTSTEKFDTITDDPQCLAMLKNYRSLMPMAMEARKPMFSLTPADGAIGAHMSAVKDCYKDFQTLAKRIADTVEVSLD